MKLTIVVWLAVVNLLVSADVSSDDNVSKGKREAPMAEPSQEYLPPRLEAPYATFQPIVVPQHSYFRSTSFNQPQTGALQAPVAPAYEYNRFAGVIPLQTVENNDLVDNQGQSYNNNQGSSYNNNQGPSFINQGSVFNNQVPSYNNNPGPPYYNNIYGVSGAYTEGSSYGGANSYGSFIKYGQGSNIPTHYGSSNGLGQSLNVYTGGNGFENNDQYSTIKNSQYGNTGSNYENSFYGNPSSGSAKYPSSATLLSNQPPSYASGVKGLGHYTQTNQISNLNTHTPLKNSRPIALQPAHLQRKQPSFLTEPTKNPNFRPSFLLGSQILTSTPDYGLNNALNQPTLTSLGTNNQYIPPSTQSIPQQYTAPQALAQLPLTQQHEYLPQSTPNFLNSYQSSVPNSFGLPETVIYTKSSLYGERYGATQ
ncbi:beclin-1-like protein A [Contarinia nasturtii]|uniref:beclin-1-like protein A n=1 Tax=Contarinia nasturtii TaxID=265458 RepID=UPI0012D37A78|nr:beclin-1-like protein A [Contarinia nasturtii]